MAKTKVFINGRFLSQRLTGVQRYALETLLALDTLVAESSLGQEMDIVVLAPVGTTAPALKALRFECVGPFRGHAWEQITLPSVCRGRLLIGFAATGPLVQANQVVTLHDAAVFALPHAFSLAFRGWYRALLPLLSRRARHLMTVSQFSRDELVKFLGEVAARAVVSGEGWQHVERVASDVSVLDKHGLRSGRFLLAVGSVAPHKNLAVVARAAARLGSSLETPIVVAGGVDRTIFGKHTGSGHTALKLIGYVSDGELRALYEHAAAFIHPSKYEGFGIPPLEAMALGCPVLASNAAAIPEVCGDAAWYFSPEDDAALARLIEALLSNAQERAALIARGRAQAKQHSWRAAAAHFFTLLEAELLARRQGVATRGLGAAAASLFR